MKMPDTLMSGIFVLDMRKVRSYVSDPAFSIGSIKAILPIICRYLLVPKLVFCRQVSSLVRVAY